MCPREWMWAHRTALWRKFFPSTGVELKVARLAITNTLTAEAPQVDGPGSLLQSKVPT